MSKQKIIRINLEKEKNIDKLREVIEVQSEHIEYLLKENEELKKIQISNAASAVPSGTKVVS